MEEASFSLGQWFLVTKSWSMKHPVAPESIKAQESTICPKEPW